MSARRLQGPSANGEWTASTTLGGFVIEVRHRDLRTAHRDLDSIASALGNDRGGVESGDIVRLNDAAIMAESNGRNES